MFYPAEAFFRDSKKQVSIAHDARRRIMHLRIIDAQRQQLIQAPAFVLRLVVKSHRWRDFIVDRTTEMNSYESIECCFPDQSLARVVLLLVHRD